MPVMMHDLRESDGLKLGAEDIGSDQQRRVLSRLSEAWSGYRHRLLIDWVVHIALIVILFFWTVYYVVTLGLFGREFATRDFNVFSAMVLCWLWYYILNLYGPGGKDAWMKRMKNKFREAEK